MFTDFTFLIDLFPDESVQAALDAKVNKAMPVHWNGFALSYQHTWEEPAEEFVAFAQENRLNYMLPKLGQLCTCSESIKEKRWEKSLDQK